MTDLSPQPTNECSVVTLRNGSILLSMRSEGMARYQARSDNEGDTLVPDSLRYALDVPSPGCASGIVAATDGSLYMSHPYSPTARINMSISVSRDDGNSWTTLVSSLWPGPSGYSGMFLFGSVCDQRYVRGMRWFAIGCSGVWV